MKVRSLALLLVASALAGPALGQGTSPVYPPTGFDLSAIDSSTTPGNDFFQYANGKYLERAVIPADRPTVSRRFEMTDRMEANLHQLLQQAASGVGEQPTDVKGKAGAFYASYMDEPTIDRIGVAAIAPELNAIRAATTPSDLAALMGRSNYGLYPAIAAPFIDADLKAPDKYAIYLNQSGLGMPDRDYYLSKDPKQLDTKAKYLEHLTNVLNLAGEANAAARAKAILDFETKIAGVHWTKVQSRQADKTYNKMTLAEVGKSAPGFDFPAFLKADGVNVDYVIVFQPSAFKGVNALLGRTPMSVLRDQLLVRSIDAYADYLPKQFDQESFAFNGTVLNGTPEQEVRWKRGVNFTIATMGDDVSKLYVAKYFPPETKAAADQLVHNIIGAMDRRIDKLDWMSAETKAKAHAKLAAFTPKIGYPSQWRDMNGLLVDRGDLLGNAMRSNRFEHDYQLGKLGGPIRRWEWGMTPMTINAYSNPTMVEIVFPAAILQPPFFDPNADPAVNYGGIGAVIGHEMSHQFDDQGAKYDLHGNLVDWWTPADAQNFQSRLDRLGAQFDAYEPLPGMHVQGKLTMGENVADLAGLTVAHDAYIASLNGQAPPVIDGVSADQRFYLGWAQVWRRNYREPNLRQRLLTDPHSPSKYRTAIVRNMDPWYSAFQVQPGQQLYLAPADRVRIW
jgi:putative endopeptidase